VTARTNQVNAQYDLSIARAALKRALGEGENQ
jgi:outer membrane protein TolC